MPLLWLVCFMYSHKSLQAGQLSRAIVFLAKFIIAKYLKQKFDDDCSVCVDEHSPCDLSITVDEKICQCHVIIM